MYLNIKKTGSVLALAMGMIFSNSVFSNESHTHQKHSNQSQEPRNHAITSANSNEDTTVAPNSHTDKTTGHNEHAAHAGVNIDHEHDHQQNNETIPTDKTSHDQQHDTRVILSAEKMLLADIQVATISPTYQMSTIYAPGEVKANGYKSYIVSPRTESVIISRHAALGEHVEKGQKLVTLFSETMSQAQADYLIASTEWQRLKRLTNTTVSDSTLLQAKATYNAAYGKLIALGLTESAIGAISNKDIKAFGQYTLTAQRAGVVLQDDFIQGQRLSAGDTVMLLADEQQLWVEAKVSPSKPLDLSINAPAVIKFAGQSYPAKVIQEAHTIDPKSRTRIIRLAVDNSHDKLHSGMFVKVYFQFITQQQVTAVPEQALIRGTDGDWLVFAEQQTGEFKAVEVTLGRALGELREITGIKSGTRLVIKGAFFVASEIAKSGFDPHNH